MTPLLLLMQLVRPAGQEATYEITIVAAERCTSRTYIVACSHVQPNDLGVTYTWLLKGARLG